MRIAIVQLNPTIGAIEQNVQKMLKAIEEAKQQQAHIIVFSELVVSGLPAKDRLFQKDFVQQCIEANEKLVQASTGQLMIVWGNIARNDSGYGNALFNAAYCAVDGQIVAIAKKNSLPTYDVFYEARYFEPGGVEQAVPVVRFMDQNIAISVCEDLWSDHSFSLQEKELVTPFLYQEQPLANLKNASVDYLLNVSASPYVKGKPKSRLQLMQHVASLYNVTVVYGNQVGANDDLIFDGHSLLVKPKQTAYWQAEGFEEGVYVIESDQLPEKRNLIDEEQELIKALVLGIEDYVSKTGFKKVFVGLSGGIDSALTAVLAQKALGAENVIGVAMPGPYSSEGSVKDAEQLAANLGIEFKIHPIHSAFEAYLSMLSDGQRLQDLAEENLQARLRGTTLMTLANRHHGLVLATGNKSELAVGYSTLYGDSCGALAPIGDVYKTWVYKLCHAINEESPLLIIPKETIEKPPSAELAPNQKDQDTLPSYDMLDAILENHMERGLSFEDLLRLGYDESILTWVLRQVSRCEYKRQQCPPVLKITGKSFGSGRLFPIVQNSQTKVPTIV